jgi:hypothetical protein
MVDWKEGCELMCSGMYVYAGRRAGYLYLFSLSIAVNNMLSLIFISPIDKRM